MSRPVSVFASLLALFALTSAAFFSTAIAAQNKKKKGRPPATVLVAEIVEKEVSASVELVGSVRALTDVTVSAETTGRVEKFPKREGDAVKKGEAVCLLDKTTNKIRAREAKGRLDFAVADLKKAELAAIRAKDLYGEKVASLENMQNAELDVQSHKANLDLRLAELDRAEYELARTGITAPFSGFITKRYVDTGAWVEKGDNIFDIVNTRKVEVITEIPGRLISVASDSKEVQVALDAYPDKMFTGKIAALVPKANQKTRTFPVRIVLDNPKFLIKAGMFVRISIPLEVKKKALLIPRDAVVWRFRKALVFSADKEGKVKSYPVTLGRQYGERVVAKGNIKAGMKLIVSGNEILRDGQMVMVAGEKKL
ncbi:Probable Co/Zn/Cd efflux system membrane fusion protein [hydrothermal vent metagenome]|uniref:Probable Co/Zn/Cd efflux system membrane fusion protein n=1 Tax=hydrothermal vent metagenome TaxID=652676 RepID=A0A3B1C1A0_9ZZZZ